MPQETMQLDQLKSKETFEAWTQGMGLVSAPWKKKIPDIPWIFERKTVLHYFLDSRTSPNFIPVLDASKPI